MNGLVVENIKILDEFITVNICDLLPLFGFKTKEEFQETIDNVICLASLLGYHIKGEKSLIIDNGHKCIIDLSFYQGEMIRFRLNLEVDITLRAISLIAYNGGRIGRGISYSVRKNEYPLHDLINLL